MGPVSPPRPGSDRRLAGNVPGDTDGTTVGHIYKRAFALEWFIKLERR